MVKILVENPIYSRCIAGRSLVQPAITYNSFYYKQGQYRKMRVDYPVCLMNRDGIFYTGLVSSIEDYCKKAGYSCEIIHSDLMKQIDQEVQPTNEPKLNGIELREDQARLIRSAIKKRRGYLIAPTGGGKTILALSIMKAFDGKVILFLVPTLTLLRQTIDELERFEFTSVSMLGEGQKEFLGRIVVSTFQTFAKLDLNKIGHLFDVIFVDEAHIAVKKDSSYQKILSQIPAPVRIGLTATIPKDDERRLISTGLIGPLIDQVTWEEGQKEMILAEPKLRLISVPRNTKIENETYYRDIYWVGIVDSKIRNRLIISETLKLIDEGRTVLIFVKQIEHGDNLLEIANDMKINCEYIHGDTDGAYRNHIRKQLEEKKLDLVIATDIWKEGMNVKSLGAVIIAGSGKSETALLQSIGRALRRTEGKDEAIIVDFLDIGKYLSNHCVERLQIYKELGLL